MQLQGNSWLWEVAGLQILVDPVLVGNLDFGIPFLYDAAKKSKLMKEYNVRETIIICFLLLLFSTLLLLVGTSCCSILLLLLL
jgi:hypothetical protein